MHLNTDDRTNRPAERVLYLYVSALRIFDSHWHGYNRNIEFHVYIQTVFTR